MVLGNGGFLMVEYGSVDGFNQNGTSFTLHDGKGTVCSYDTNISEQGIRFKDKVVIIYSESRLGGVLIQNVLPLADVKYGRGKMTSDDIIKSDTSYGTKVVFVKDNLFVQTGVRYNTNTHGIYTFGQNVRYEAINRQGDQKNVLHAIRVFLQHPNMNVDGSMPSSCPSNGPSTPSSSSNGPQSPLRTVTSISSSHQLSISRSSSGVSLKSESEESNVSPPDKFMERNVTNYEGIIIQKHGQYYYLWSRDLGRVLCEKTQVPKASREVAKWLRFNGRQMPETEDFINWWASDVISIAPKLQFARGDWESKFEVKDCSCIVMTLFDNWAIGWNEMIGRILIDRNTVGERQWNKCDIKSFKFIKFRANIIERNDQFYYRDLGWKATDISPWTPGDDDDDDEMPEFATLRCCCSTFTLSSTRYGFFTLKHPTFNDTTVTFTDFHRLFESAGQLHRHLKEMKKKNFEIIYVPILKQYETNKLRWRAIYVQPYKKGQKTLKELGFISAQIDEELNSESEEYQSLSDEESAENGDPLNGDQNDQTLTQSPSTTLTEQSIYVRDKVFGNKTWSQVGSVCQLDKVEFGANDLYDNMKHVHDGWMERTIHIVQGDLHWREDAPEEDDILEERNNCENEMYERESSMFDDFDLPSGCVWPQNDNNDYDEDDQTQTNNEAGPAQYATVTAESTTMYDQTPNYKQTSMPHLEVPPGFQKMQQTRQPYALPEQQNYHEMSADVDFGLPTGCVFERSEENNEDVLYDENITNNKPTQYNASSHVTWDTYEPTLSHARLSTTVQSNVPTHLTNGHSRSQPEMVKIRPMSNRRQISATFPPTEPTANVGQSTAARRTTVSKEVQTEFFSHDMEQTLFDMIAFDPKLLNLVNQQMPDCMEKILILTVSPEAIEHYQIYDINTAFAIREDSQNIATQSAKRPHLKLKNELFENEVIFDALLEENEGLVLELSC